MISFLAGLAMALGSAMIFEMWQRRGDGASDQWPIAARTEPQREEAAMGGEGQTAARAESAPPRSAPSRPDIQENAARDAQSLGSAEELLNSATRQQLLSVYGIGPVLADRIIQNRPYTAAYEVVEKGIIPERIFAQLQKQLLEQSA
ncbi:MAG TPA: hypothetical protein VKT29_13950 [Terriglobales bacterium]|nr:hypothetical protein [Terriglobales bacterium]